MEVIRTDSPPPSYEMRLSPPLYHENRIELIPSIDSPPPEYERGVILLPPSYDSLRKHENIIFFRSFLIVLMFNVFGIFIVLTDSDCLESMNISVYGIISGMGTNLTISSMVLLYYLDLWKFTYIFLLAEIPLIFLPFFLFLNYKYNYCSFRHQYVVV
jgi:hypothetical protein